MFVRKGTVRKARGGSNRRASTRRPGRDVTSNGTVIKANSSADQQAGSSGYHVPSKKDHNQLLPLEVSKSSSVVSSVAKTLSFAAQDVAHHDKNSEHHNCSLKNENTVKPSPARSLATTIVVRHFIKCRTR
ncbi:hypothetical protein DPMN_108327 [Dreissena polymorpha]|uniref:Uncharacterized protein n=1 Tax=Dreissena polymorpha TaxID=45954 RepID=A0A9D4K8P6_DREPO|nr:hypothetical protein DPMN_108327 [Dreissena polymorpha]